MNIFEGNFGIITTPFDCDGNVNYNELENNVERLCNTDIKGIVCCGSTSEFVFLSNEENKKIMTAVHNATKGRKLLIGGATSANKDDSIDYLKHMDKLSFNGALIAPPFYFRYSDEEVLEFYKELNKNNYGVPIIIYSIPAFTNGISINIFSSLLELGNIAGLKNSSQNIKDISHQVEIKEQIRPEFSILTGTDDSLLPSLVAGCVGNFTAFGALLPNEIDLIYKYYNNGQLNKASKIQKAILPLLRLCDSMTFPIGYKLLGEVVGLKNEYYHQSLTEEQKRNLPVLKEKIKQCLEETEILIKNIISE